MTNNLKSLRKELEAIGNSTGLEKVNKQLETKNNSLNTKKAFGITSIIAGATSLYQNLKEMTNESINFLETTNLFNVSLGKGVEGLNQYYEQAVEFQEKLTEKLGVNLNESMKYQALFNQMAKSMSISADKAYLLSENFTKLGYDLASLYNIDTTEAMRKLRAGLAGETEPLRAIGLDITEQSLQPVLDSLGIDESLRNMTQAEKIILRYIALMKQASASHGDFANTINAPAQQLKIFNAQITTLKRNIGNLWQGMLGGILPYINAIIMVINELLQMLAELFNIEFNFAPVNVSVGADDLASDLDDATGSAKKLKNQLLGFDEINNITINTGSTGSSGGGSVGGIDQRLLDAMKEYDNLMENVKSKAHEIKDKMMEWLGFHRTDDGGWELNEGYTNIEKIRDAAILVGATILGWKIAPFIQDLINAEKKATKLKNTMSRLGTAVALGLGISSLFAFNDGVQGIKDGKITSEDLLKSIGGSIGLGTTVAYLAKGLGFKISIPIGAILAIGGITATLNEIGAQNSVAKIMNDVLDIAFPNFSKTITGKNIELGINQLGFSIDVIAFIGLKEGLYTAIKNVLNTVARWVEKIPVIGKSIATGLRIGANIEIPKTQETIKYATQEAMEQANPWIKELAGKYTRQNIQDTAGILGSQESLNLLSSTSQNLAKETIVSATDEIGRNRDAIKSKVETTTVSAINNSLGNIKRTAQSTGNQIPTSMSTGVNESANRVITSTAGLVDKIERETRKVNTKTDGENIVTGISTGISNNINKATKSAKELIAKIKENVERINTEQAGKYSVEGIAKGIEKNKNSWKLWDSLRSLKNVIVNGIENLLGIQSPSRVMADVAKWIPLGVAKGIDSEADTVYASMAKLSKGIEINSKDISLDTSQYVDYSAISGNIATQTNLLMSSNMTNQIGQACYNAFVNAMRNEGIKVEIEAKTEEGTLVRKISQGLNEIVEQTGELPFTVPV